MPENDLETSSGGQYDFLAGAGEMGELIRTKDWSLTPLGPIESWSQSLRTTVSLCLASNFPISLAWGPERTQIYNDGYWPICAAKHPHSMGQDFKQCWLSAWPAIGEAFERASSGETAYLENQRMFLDRRGYLEETFFTFSFSPIRDESGNVAGLFHPVTELTQQTLAERRLKVLRDIADRTPEAESLDAACRLITGTLDSHELDVPFALLYLLDTEGRQATLSGIAGLSPGAPHSQETIDLQSASRVGWPLSEAAASRNWVWVEDLDSLFDSFTCGPYTESPSTAIVLPLIVSGLEHPIGLLVAAVSPRRALDEPYRMFYRMLQEAVTSALTNARNLQEERKRAESLAELDRAKTTFFSNISHEFRTPLTLLLGPLQDAIQDAKERHQQDRLEMVYRGGLRLQKLVNALLDFALIEAGRTKASYQPTDLAALTAELASNFRSACDKAGLRLSVDCRPLSKPVYVDRDMWEKVVLNLISNAFKFTLHGEIAVSLTEEVGAARLVVRDTGTGISTEQLPHIFERFHRVEGARARTHEGAGIGLALVQELVILQGGKIGVESVEGRGTTFVVTIPLGTAHLSADCLGQSETEATKGVGANAFLEEALRWVPSPAQITETDLSPADPVRAEGRRPVVLVADDNADMRDYLRTLLAVRYEVATVGDGESALVAARAQPPDVIIADVMMPMLDGFGLVRKLRDDAQTASIPIIMLSARAGEEARVEGLQAGADDYLVKPFSARELLARVQSQLELAGVRQQADEALRYRGEQFATLLTNAPLGVYLVDADFQIAEVNPVAMSKFGEIPGGVIGRDFDEITHMLWEQEYADEIVRIFRHTLETGEAYVTPERAEFRVDRGITEYYEWRLDRITLPDGSFGLVCYFRDISHQVLARKAIEESREALQASEARLQMELSDTQHLQSTSSELIREDNIQGLFEKIIDAAVAIMRSQYASIQIFYPERGDGGELRLLAFRGFSPESAKYWEWVRADSASCCGMALRTGERSVVSDVESCEFMAGTKDLEVYLQNGIRAVHTTPLLSRSGTPLGMISTHWSQPHEPSARDLRLLDILARQAADLIERRKSEQALRESEERFRMVADNISQLAWMCDRLGNVTWYNQRWLEYTGLPFEEMKGWGWSKVQHPDHLDRVVATMKRSAEAGERWEDTFPLRGRDGQYRWFLSRAVPIHDEAGNIMHWFGTNTDITELRAAQEALRESDRRKDEFLATLAHELRNPLAPIRTGLELMRMANGDQAMVEEVRATMEGQTRQLVRLVDDLLDVSRIASGRITLKTERVALANIVESAVEATRNLVQEAGHELSIALPEQPVHLDADSTRLTQILSNLLSNAARYTQRAGQIWLTAESRGNEVLIAVKDTGVGLPADALESIFEMFTQVDRSLERSQSGLGIGLTLVKQLVELHGGSVAARSDGPGLGSEFTVRLPIASEPTQQRQESEDEEEGQTGGLRILVVDDHDDAAKMLCTVVKLLGHEACMANDGLEAVEAASKFAPDVVLMDIGMPNMNGYDAAHLIRAQPWGKDLVLVALTGWGQEEDRQRSKDAGFDHHLVKPLEPAELRALLTDGVNRSN